MAQHALGEVKPASTVIALRATNNMPTLDPPLTQPAAKNFSCTSLQFQALATNTGKVFIVDRETPDLTKNVLVEIPAPANSIGPSWSIGDPTKVAAFDAATFWILPAVSGEGVRVTIIR